MKSKMSAKQVIRLAKKNFPDWEILRGPPDWIRVKLKRKCPINAAANKSYFGLGDSIPYLGLSSKLSKLIIMAADDNCKDNKTCQQIRQRMLRELVGDNT